MESSSIALIIIGVMMILYITELIPLAATSLLACISLAVFGVIPLTDAFKGFGNDIVFLLLGMIVVGDALFETGVAGSIGKKIISLVGTNEKAFIGALIVVILPISIFISNTATMAMALPIAASAIAASGGKLRKKDTYMIIGMASVVGGGLTLVSSTPQLIAQSLLIEGGYEPIGFFELSYTGLPVVLLLIVYVMTVGHSLKKKIFNFPEPEDIVSGNQTTAAESGKAPATAAESGKAPATAAESGKAPAAAAESAKTPKDIARMCISVAVLVFCVIGFLTGLWSYGIVAMAGAVICVATGCISQQRVFQKMNWTTVVIMGCSFGIAAGLEQSGAGKLVAHGMISLLGEHLSPWLLCAALALVAVIITNFMSSTATAALLVPIAALVAIELGYSVKSMVMSVAIAANIGYATPISTPPITMTLAGGYRFMDYVKFGGLFNILAYLLTIALFPLFLIL